MTHTLSESNQYRLAFWLAISGLLYLAFTVSGLRVEVDSLRRYIIDYDIRPDSDSLSYKEADAWRERVVGLGLDE